MTLLTTIIAGQGASRRRLGYSELRHTLVIGKSLSLLSHACTNERVFSEFTAAVDGRKLAVLNKTDKT